MVKFFIAATATSCLASYVTALLPAGHGHGVEHLPAAAHRPFGADTQSALGFKPNIVFILTGALHR